ncbi:MAG: DALR anticodon-binding domain-containing protein [Marinisporobacter sp.]|jgi:arginyl-tRNA synthetase|nr:DALR anticodon-binding domain-containing protein [Marinisporobacter sp.]
MENKGKIKIQKMTQKILKDFFEYEIEIDLIEVVEPKKNGHGDYTTNVALRLAKVLKKSPMDIASNIVENIKNKYDLFEKIESVHPGFINFFFKPHVLCELIVFEEEEMKLNKKLLKDLLEECSLKEMIKEHDLKDIESVQYTHSRTCSIIKIFEEEGIEIQDLQKENLDIDINQLEKNLMKKMIEYPIVIEKAVASKKIYGLVIYMFELNELFYRFHEKILFRKLDKPKLYVTLKIVENIRNIMKNILGLFSVEAPEKM